MPSKIQLDENLWFLYICIQKSDMKSIDFTAVGAATSLKPPAARMRYTRLRRQIESGTLIGTHGTPFASPVMLEEKEKKGVGESKKRKRPIKKEGFSAEGGNANGEEQKIKAEESSGYESDSSGLDSSDDGSEDEMPLAKLAKLSKKHASASTFTSTANPTPPGENLGPGPGPDITSTVRDGFSNGGRLAPTQRFGPAQKELQALIPTGRVEFAYDSSSGSGNSVGNIGMWGASGEKGGFWSQRYERQIGMGMDQRQGTGMGGGGADLKPRKSV